MSGVILTRGRSGKTPLPHICEAKRSLGEDIVQSGLSISPSDIEKMALNGVSVSVPNSDCFFKDAEITGFDVPLELKRDVDRNTVWEQSKVAQSRILSANKKDKERFS